MALRLCTCGRHVRASDRVCPFCGATALGEVTRQRRGRAPRVTIFVCAAAALVACAARSELGVVSVASDASADGSNQDEASKQHGSDGAASVDADENDVVLVSDGHGISDAIDECVPVNGECKSNSDCCDDFCGWGNRCGAEVPPYGSPVPPP